MGAEALGARLLGPMDLRLAGLYLGALERLARQHERDQRWPEAIGCAERLVAHDPLREESHRLLMQRRRVPQLHARP